MRNVDYDFVNSEGYGKPPYIISKPVSSDRESRPNAVKVLNISQVSADPLLHATV